MDYPETIDLTSYIAGYDEFIKETTELCEEDIDSIVDEMRINEKLD